MVLNTPSPSPGIQSQLHRNLGLLALAKGQLSEARRHLAEDIYQSSVAFGPEAVQTAGGYFHLATAFAGEDRPDVVLSLHNEVGGGWALLKYPEWIVNHYCYGYYSYYLSLCQAIYSRSPINQLRENPAVPSPPPPSHR